MQFYAAAFFVMQSAFALITGAVMKLKLSVVIKSIPFEERKIVASASITLAASSKYFGLYEYGGRNLSGFNSNRFMNPSHLGFGFQFKFSRCDRELHGGIGLG